MPELSQEAILELILSSADALLATRYLAGSAAAVLIYDALLVFDREVAYIYPLPIGLTKTAFVFTRYVTMGSLIYANYMLSGLGNPTELECKAFLVLLCVLTMLFSAAANAFIALRLYAIWDQRKIVRMILYAALAVTYIPMMVLLGFSAIKYYRNTFLVPLLHTCLVAEEDVLVKGVFGCTFAFDIIVIALAVSNALDRPRGPQHKLIENIKRDGAIWFFVLCLMRLVNFLIFLLLPPDQTLVAIFVTWALISITLSRMILRVEAMKRPPTGSGVMKANTWNPDRNAFQLDDWSQRSLTVRPASRDGLD